VTGDTVDRDEYGEPVKDRYRRLGANGEATGVYVRFEPGFGLNVHIGFRSSYTDHEGLILSIVGWERLCELADEWRARQVAS